MACVTANLLVLHMMNPVAHSCRLHGLPTALWFAPSRSDFVCLFTRINHGERQSKSRACVIKTVHSSLERTSADVCLKKYLGFHMIQRRNIVSWCMVSIAIPNVVTVETQILLFPSRLRVPTLTWKMQLASIWSISCKIQRLVNQQSQQKIQWSMFRKRTFHLYRQANTAISTQFSTRRRHQADQGKSGLEAERVKGLGALCILCSQKNLAAGKWRETRFLSNEAKEKWIEDYVGWQTPVATKRVEDAETALTQKQDDMRNAQ